MTDRLTDRALATSADYADALLVARKAKHLLFTLILLMLVVQLALFFVARYSDFVPVRKPADTAPVAVAATLPAEIESATTSPAPTAVRSAGRELPHYLSGLTLFLGTILPILLALTLLVIVNIMLVGRLIGVTRVLSAFFWCLLLLLLMFPWQIYYGVRSDPSDFRLPGVLYTWNDLRSNARFEGGHTAVVKWARFCVMPVVATIILMIVQAKSNRGLRQALGEAPPTENISISV